jgi:hypothetical protein
MQEFIQAIDQAIVHLHQAKPNAQLWAGDAATKCSLSIDEIVADLQQAKARMQLHLDQLVALGIHDAASGVGHMISTVASTIGGWAFGGKNGK